MTTSDTWRRPSGSRGEEILDAAARIFAEQGYDTTSIDDIADDLGATKGMIYHHYRSKDALLLGVLMSGARALIEAVRPLAADHARTSRERLFEMARQHALITMIDVYYQRTAFQSLHQHVFLAQTSRHRAWKELHGLRDEYQKYFEQVLEEGRGTEEFQFHDVGITARAVLGTLNWVNVWYRPNEHSSDERAHIEHLATELAGFVVAGAVAASPAPETPTHNSEAPPST